MTPSLPAGAFRIRGSQEPNPWLTPYDGPEFRLEGCDAVVEHTPEDLIVTVGAGLSLDALQATLAEQGQTLPIGWQPWRSQTVGGLISMGGWHGLESQHGTIRDWVLGVTLVRPSGEVASAGARVVKSVAGFDVHKSVVGARGEWGVLIQAHLRVLPLARLQASALRWQGDPAAVRAVQRVPRSEFGLRLAEPGVLGSDPESSILLRSDWPEPSGEGWQYGWGGRRWPEAHPLEARAKQVLDPQAQLVGGWS